MSTTRTFANIDTSPIQEALRELRARMEGFKHYGDGWTWEEQEAAEGALQALLAHERQRRQLLRDLNDAEGAWVWQGDGEDDLESLTCPVLISAEALRGLVARSTLEQEPVAWIVEGMTAIGTPYRFATLNAGCAAPIDGESVTALIPLPTASPTPMEHDWGIDSYRCLRCGCNRDNAADQACTASPTDGDE